MLAVMVERAKYWENCAVIVEHNNNTRTLSLRDENETKKQEVLG